jgi:hypothetical protein
MCDGDAVNGSGQRWFQPRQSHGTNPGKVVDLIGSDLLHEGGHTRTVCKVADVQLDLREGIADLR